MRELRIAMLIGLIAVWLGPVAAQAQRTGGPLSQPAPAQAASAQEIPDAVVLDEYDESGAVLGGEMMGNGWDDACPTCGGYSISGDCDSCGGCLRSNCQFCDRIFISVDYLNWWQQSMGIPPLVTTSPANTAQNQAGVLGQANTTVLVGNSPLFQDVRSGVRLRGGIWMDCQHIFGIEGEFWFLDNDAEHFRQASDGTMIIARPFFNVLTNQEDSELVSFPDVVRGEVLVDAETSIRSGGVRSLINLCCSQGCITDCVAGCPTTGPVSTRWDLLLGYRYMGMEEGLLIREGLVSLLPPPDDGTFNISDGFYTKNQFHGVDIGLRNEWQKMCWGVSLLAKVALGNTHQYAAISGSTITTVNGVSTPQVGGLLAQATNIGQYSRNQFSAVPEIGISTSYLIKPRLRLTLGYSLTYWFDVVRPGAQIDRRVNTNLLPPPVLPLQGEPAPLFAFQESSLWLQGLNLGLEFRW